MKLLIVDDQIYVAQGLRFGIDWKAEGFSEVFIALNALEARAVLQKNAVDVMLCDIEMPMENGLSLIRWVREQKMPTRCILLTAHPDFQYAREACCGWCARPSRSAASGCAGRKLPPLAANRKSAGN